MSDLPRQVGPTLYWSRQPPQVGELFESHGQTYRVIEVTPDIDVSGGYLFTTEPA